ncbi:hypothetical protein RUM43_000699 [Polyplax serrata]|uniref:MICOS complex subunit MIC13 n=1 Tax=Polyplax serrata TaxID=468196 RepID=A0AAN8SD56_POLSC
MSRLLRFGVKAGIMSSAVYLTIDKGVWKDSETTTALYEDIKNKVTPLVEPIAEQVPFTLPQLPKTGDVVSTAKTAWNKGVMASCLFLVELPELTWEYAKKGTIYTYNKINEEIQSLNAIDKDKSNESKI